MPDRMMALPSYSWLAQSSLFLDAYYLDVCFLITGGGESRPYRDRRGNETGRRLRLRLRQGKARPVSTRDGGDCLWVISFVILKFRIIIIKI